MKMSAYVISGHEFHVRPAPLTRQWMDDTPLRYAYRCLPLAIANRHGWEVLAPARVSARWNGGPLKSDIIVTCEDGMQTAVSHFGNGVLTFHINAILRTEPGFDIMACGPLNAPRDGVHGLAGIIETDWSPYSFTMNWLFTRPDHEVVWEKGDPICHFFPLARGALEGVEPELHMLAEEGELQARYNEWAASRSAFNAGLAEGASEATRAGWQRAYFRGLNPDGSAGAEDHLSKLRLQPFAIVPGDGDAAGVRSAKVDATFADREHDTARG